MTVALIPQLTAQQEFEKVMLAAYGVPPEKGSDQYNQLRDAFFAGCMIGCTRGMKIWAEVQEWSQQLHLRANQKRGESA